MVRDETDFQMRMVLLVATVLMLERGEDKPDYARAVERINAAADWLYENPPEGEDE